MRWLLARSVNIKAPCAKEIVALRAYHYSFAPNLLGNHSVLDPPDPMPNSVVKRNSADDSVAFAM